MPRFARTLTVVSLLLLAGCGLVRRDGAPAAPDVAGTPTKPGAPAPVKPGAPPTKPADKGDPQQRFDAALAMMRGNQTEEAEAALMALTADFPQFGGPWTDLGIIYAKSNRRDAAITALARAVTINRSNAIAHNWLGILYRERRDFVRAERAYQAALNALPNYGLAHLNLGILYDEHLKRPLDALPHYKAYQQFGGKDDLRVLAWIAEIEASQKAAATPAAAPVAAEPRR